MNARIPDAFEQFTDPSSPAFNYTQQIVSPQWSPGPTTLGATYGVPPATNIAGMEPGAGSVASASASAQQTLSNGPGQHPVLWAVIIFSAGFILLGAVAHFELKRR